MGDLHVLSGTPNEVNHLIYSGLERMCKLFPSREPEEVSRLDFLFPGLGLPVIIKEDTSTFSGFYDVEPLILMAVPVRDSADVVWGKGVEVDAPLGQATFVAKVYFVFEGLGV